MAQTDKQKNLGEALAQIEKQFGKGSIMRLGAFDTGEPIPVISTGSIALDKALGVGGVPRGRVIELFGPESCIDSGTRIQYNILSENGNGNNHKGGTIKRLYEKFHNKPSSKWVRTEENKRSFTINSINESGRIITQPIADVVKTGVKNCYELTTTSGEKITATKEHKFYTPSGYKELGNLSIGDIIYIHNNTTFKKTHKRIDYKEDMVKYHPHGGKKIIEGKYIFFRRRKCVLVYEAYLNGFSYEEFKKNLNTLPIEEISKLKFIQENYDVHHIDENPSNDNLENLMLMEKSEHYRHHSTKNHNNLRFTIVEDVIKSIRPVGPKETYDIKCYAPYNNYVANKFVVHNSGKTTLALHIISEAQKAGGTAAFIDAEHALDASYARALGVDIDNLLLSQPDTGEQALEITEALTRSNAVDCIVIDSVAALVPRAEIEGEFGDSHMGLQARLMSQALRKLTGTVSKSGTTIIFINQIRMKIGVMFGNPETTPGGNALKFYTSVRLDIRRMSSIKDGDNVIGNHVRVRVVKNKVAPPLKDAEFDILFGRGINYEGELIDLGVTHNIIKKSGSWYTYGEEKMGQGREAARDFLLNNPAIKAKIKEGVLLAIAPVKTPITNDTSDVPVLIADDMIYPVLAESPTTKAKTKKETK